MRITQCATDASLDRGAGLTGQRSTFLAGLFGVEAPPQLPPPPVAASLADLLRGVELGVATRGRADDGEGFAYRIGGCLIVAMAAD